MTKTTIEQIYSLKKQGISTAEIGRRLNISAGTLRSFLKRNPLPQEPDICKCCGATIRQIPGRKPIVFCSDSCKTKWWNNHRHERESCVKSKCIRCGRTITAYGSANRKYCSQECYKHARKSFQLRVFNV